MLHSTGQKPFAHNKAYGPEEYYHRLQVFADNKRQIDEHNAANHTFQMSLNQFSDMTFAEFKKKYLWSQPQNCSATKGNFLRSSGPSPDSIDWRKKGNFVTPVKNQYDEAGMVEAVGKHNPVSFAFEVTSDFMHYRKGVYSNPRCEHTPDKVNHAVLAVGYGEERGTPHWIVKNSWGPFWGMDGYFLIERGKNMCGLAACASYPIPQVGFTFKKRALPGSAPSAECLGTPSSSALKDKDVNASLSKPFPCPAASKDKNIKIQEFFPRAPSGQELKPPCASQVVPASLEGLQHGSGDVPAHGARTGRAHEAAPAALVTVEDEWDDIDDFDLSGVDKKYSRPILSPKGQSSSKTAQRSRSPVKKVTSSAAAPSACERDEASLDDEQGLSQGSLICLGDVVPCNSGRAAGKDPQENLPTEVISHEEAAPAAAGVGNKNDETQRLSGGERNGQEELDAADDELLASLELEEEEEDLCPCRPPQRSCPPSPQPQETAG
ncbi:PREDICTED: pro-cathepsin H [Tinamus guttatus]|uniref:pro-cathepsin H n=1 Tax=Tinamus guttatus TaxID=94827 RepID=UPI00052EC14A|nr:PREDICTED: pro-cathepsin H [Tinamus guttatus]